MKRLSLKNLNSILKFEKNEYKYLSPNIFKNNQKYYMLFCNRKSSKSFYGEINLAASKNLKNWKKVSNFVLKPEKKSEYISFVSPCILKKNKVYYLFVEAQKTKGSDILCFISKTLKKWTSYPRFKLKKKYNTFHSPFIIKINNNLHLYYSLNRKKIVCLILDNDFSHLKCITCLKSNFSNEANTIYSPSIIKLNDRYFMLYAAWKNKSLGNINCAYSFDGVLWKKTKNNIFKIKNHIKIVSEPFLVKIKNKIYIFFEYKKKDHWNIGYYCLDKSSFIKYF